MNLTSLARRGSHGKDWYTIARPELDTIASSLGVTPHRFASILAVTSPKVSVVRNIKFAVHYLRTGEYLSDMMRGVRASVEHFEETGEIRGPKTRAFRDAILGDQSAVVLDVWMARAMGVDQQEFRRLPKYRKHAQRVRRVAYRLGWTPAQVQAAVWTTARAEGGFKYQAFSILATAQEYLASLSA
jgi:hypothetical protein